MRFDCPGCSYGAGYKRLKDAEEDGILVCPRCHTETPWSQVAAKARMGTHFDGRTYEPEKDRERLGKQLEAVRALMRDGRWRTLAEIAHAVGAPEASVSARLRDMRKEKFGADLVRAQRRAGGALWEYRVDG